MSPTPTNPLPADLIPIQLSGPSHTMADTTIQQAQTNTYFAVSQQVDQLNKAKTEEFLTQFNSWKSNYLSGAAALDKMPAPPKAFVIGYFDDPTTGKGDGGQYTNIVIQWPFPSQTGGPVIAPPPVPVLPRTLPASSPAWFSALGGTVKTAVAGDTFPVGGTITDPNGAEWVKKSSSTPFGTAYFYEKKP